MPGEIAQSGFARRVEPTFHPREVPVPGSVWKIVGQGPDAKQPREQMRLHAREHKFNGLRWRRHAGVQQSRLKIKKRVYQSSAVVHHAQLHQSGLKSYA